MNAYLAIVSARFRMLLQYRAAALAGFGTQLFWGLIRVMIFGAFYRSTTLEQPISFSQVVSYVWLGQALLAIIPFTVDLETRAMIRNGTVAYEMLRPLDLYSNWYCKSIAARSAPTLLRGIPMFAIALLFFGLQPPPTWQAAGTAAVSILLAILISAAIATIMAISMLWTISGEGVVQFLAPASYFLSGIVVPLPLLPVWAQKIISVLPFRGLMDTPFRLYMGHFASDQIAGVLWHQIAWIAILILIGRWMFQCATRHLVVQGG